MSIKTAASNLALALIYLIAITTIVKITTWVAFGVISDNPNAVFGWGQSVSLAFLITIGRALMSSEYDATG